MANHGHVLGSVAYWGGRRRWSRIARAEGDVGGHIAGYRFVKEQGAKNLFPQEANFNNSAYKTMENEFADWTKSDKQVKATFDFHPPGADRPDLDFPAQRIPLQFFFGVLERSNW